MWSGWPSLGLLIDAGEGIAGDLEDEVGAYGTVAMTHGHGDHTLGLMGLTIARLSRTTRAGGPVAIHYPAGTREIELLAETAPKLFLGIPEAVWAERLSWHPIEAGARIPLGGKRELVAFPTVHHPEPYRQSLGYAVVESFTQLKPEWIGRAGSDIAAAARTHGRAAVEVRATRTLMAHSGDTRVIDAAPLAEAAVRVLDATFLRAGDRDEGPAGHAALEEWCHHFRGTPGHVILHHVSLRYPRTTLADEIRALVGDAFPGGVSLLDGRGCEEIIHPRDTPG
jgi:ribonuclease BN (tRNA processing enzyme)